MGEWKREWKLPDSGIERWTRKTASAALFRAQGLGFFLQGCMGSDRGNGIYYNMKGF